MAINIIVKKTKDELLQSAQAQMHRLGTVGNHKQVGQEIFKKLRDKSVEGWNDIEQFIQDTRKD